MTKYEPKTGGQPRPRYGILQEVVTTKDTSRGDALLADLAHCEACLAEREAELQLKSDQLRLLDATLTARCKELEAEVEKWKRIANESVTGNCYECGMMLDVCDCMNESELEELNQ